MRSGRKNEMIYVNGAVSELEQDKAMMERAILGIKMICDTYYDDGQGKYLRESVNRYLEHGVIEFPIDYEDICLSMMPTECITNFAQFLVNAGENVEEVHDLMVKAGQRLYELADE
jgi:hypothetical protein